MTGRIPFSIWTRPIFGREHFYGRGIFFADDFVKLAECLKGINGHFLLSINDTPEVREIFSAFTIEEIYHQYSSVKKVRQKVVELLIKNY